MSTLASVILRDVFANRPPASIPGRLFYATDTGNTYRDNGTGWDAWGGGLGTVTTVSVVSANGFQGTVATATTTPAITLNVDGSHYLPTTTDEANWNAKQAAINFTSASSLGGTITGTIDGTNTAFTLPSAPNPAAFLMLFQNGLLVVQGTHYTLSSATVTFAVAPSTGDNLAAFYVH